MFCFYVDDVRRAVLPKAWQGESTEMTVPISFHNIGYEGDGAHVDAVEITDPKSTS